MFAALAKPDEDVELHWLKVRVLPYISHILLLAIINALLPWLYAVAFLIHSNDRRPLPSHRALLALWSACMCIHRHPISLPRSARRRYLPMEIRSIDALDMSLRGVLPVLCCACRECRVSGAE